MSIVVAASMEKQQVSRRQKTLLRGIARDSAFFHEAPSDILRASPKAAADQVLRYAQAS
jgi:hypothetical protein